jgi:hypothetical protein
MGPCWPGPLTLPLLMFCSETAWLLDGDAGAWARVRAKIRANAGAGAVPASDMPGLMRQCLALAEERREPEWVGLLRLLYHGLAPQAAATTELVLEQCIKVSAAAVDMVVRDLQAHLEGEEAAPAGTADVSAPW